MKLRLYSTTGAICNVCTQERNSVYIIYSGRHTQKVNFNILPEIASGMDVQLEEYMELFAIVAVPCLTKKKKKSE